MCVAHRASRVDVKKLEKQEAKLKVCMGCICLVGSSDGGLMCLCYLRQAKIEKRARRDLYEGSKLLDQHRKQVSSTILYVKDSVHQLVCQQNYEEMFMKVRSSPSCQCAF